MTNYQNEIELAKKINVWRMFLIWFDFRGKRNEYNDSFSFNSLTIYQSGGLYVNEDIIIKLIKR